MSTAYRQSYRYSYWVATGYLYCTRTVLSSRLLYSYLYFILQRFVLTILVPVPYVQVGNQYRYWVLSTMYWTIWRLFWLVRLFLCSVFVCCVCVCVGVCVCESLCLRVCPSLKSVCLVDQSINPLPLSLSHSITAPLQLHKPNTGKSQQLTVRCTCTYSYELLYYSTSTESPIVYIVDRQNDRQTGSRLDPPYSTSTVAISADQ